MLGLELYLGWDWDLALPVWGRLRFWDREQELLNLFLASDSVPMYIVSMSLALLQYSMWEGAFQYRGLWTLSGTFFYLQL